MFRLSLEPINPVVTKTWLTRCGVAVAGTSIVSIATLVERIRHMFPEPVLRQLPNYEQFIYMAVGIAFVTALPLTIFRIVACLSFAQLGFSSSLLYLACSILGVFIQGYENILLVLLLVMVLLFLIAFSVGPRFAYRERSWSDLIAGLLLLLVFLAIWLYPIWKIWRSA